MGIGAIFIDAKRITPKFNFIINGYAFLFGVPTNQSRWTWPATKSKLYYPRLALGRNAGRNEGHTYGTNIPPPNLKAATGPNEAYTANERHRRS